jgi:hypothetical protein
LNEHFSITLDHEDGCRYHVFNIGQPSSNAWWSQLLDRGVLTAGFMGDLGDRGTVIFEDMNEGDWVVAYANGYGFVGAGRVLGEETYRLHDAIPEGSLSDHRHERGVAWHFVICDIAHAVTLKESGRHAPRHTKERETAALLRTVELIRQRGIDVTRGLERSGPDEFWLVLDATLALVAMHKRAPTAAEVGAYILAAKPSYKDTNVRSDLSFLTVNDNSRGHYQRLREGVKLRSDQGHVHDRLFKRTDVRGVVFEPYVPARHGVWELWPDYKGRPRLVSAPHFGPADAALEEAVEHTWGEEAPAVDPDVDTRIWQMRAVAQRQGQPEFRSGLLVAYGHRCAITGCEATEVLEAAHIVPHRGQHTMRIDNGLLLRADIHTLFDLGRIWIDPESRTVRISESLSGTEYAALEGRPLATPTSPSQQPHPEHLRSHARYHGRIEAGDFEAETP